MVLPQVLATSVVAGRSNNDSITSSANGDSPSSPKASSNGKNKVTIKQVAIALAVDITQITIAYVVARYLVSHLQAKNDAPVVSPAYDDLSDEDEEQYKKSFMGRIRNMWSRATTGNEHNPTYGDESIAEEGAALDPALVRKRQIRHILSKITNPHERAIAGDVIDPDRITIKFHDIGGIDNIKAELWELVVLPLVRPELFQSESGLVSPPRGILLYGQPGTGKTMLAKAIAKESGAAFVNVRLSSVMNKWFGESNKLVAATFSLAQRLAPSIIFIDEIDTFLKNRDGDSNDSAVGSMKSEFLTMWDGMLTDNAHSKYVVVLAATNRPYDVDSAVLRRLPRSFEICLPNAASRLDILKLFLQLQSMTQEARDFIPQLAKKTEGYSGSDLKELCRAAAMEPIREISAHVSRRHVMKAEAQTPQDRAEQIKSEDVDVRSVEKKDFLKALQRVKRTGEAATTYKRETSKANVESSGGMDLNDLMRGAAMLQQMMNPSNNNSAPGGGNADQKDSSEDDSDSDDEVPNV
jgi:SpoVK/Ycf46/Vps4 family AAA+-type ATPase